MRAWLDGHGFETFLASPQYLTVRARFPRHPRPSLAEALPGLQQRSGLTVDFVLCRADGTYTDGRHPDTVQPGTIYDDLARRDFTVNAIARHPDGHLLDPHGGLNDLNDRLLRAVGDAEQRLREDSLRALRAIRFAITKGFTLDGDLRHALASDWLPPLLSVVPGERRRAELHKAFKSDTPATIALLARCGPDLLASALGNDLWLKPTNES
jgi:tRNA nucleotidyltransferase/poly(A) polymerase